MRDGGRETLFTRPDSPTKPKATSEYRAELLARLREQRQELINACVAGLGADEPVMPSILAPIGMVHLAVLAIEAELSADNSTFPGDSRSRGPAGERLSV